MAFCSALTGDGIEEAWAVVERFYRELDPVGTLASRRQGQLRQWLEELVGEELITRFRRHPAVELLRTEIEPAVARGEITAVRAVRALFEVYDKLPGGNRPEARSPKSELNG